MTNNKQQMAVEWLVEKMLTQDWYTYKSLEYIKQAKEMEIAGKEMSYDDGYAEGYKRALDYISMSIENAKALISTEII
jgi:hypothetical protein